MIYNTPKLYNYYELIPDTYITLKLSVYYIANLRCFILILLKNVNRIIGQW